MLRKRIIFTLIYENEFFNQSRNFRLQKVGNLKWLENKYKFQDTAFSIDELIVLNASKQEKKIKQFSDMLSILVDDVFIPIAVGGGIKTLEDAEILFANGADKLVLNTSLYKDSFFIKKLVRRYGSQSIIASVDYKDNDVFICNGEKKIDINIFEYLDYVQSLGVGEVYLNSIKHDGTGFGFDFGMINKVKNTIRVPLIIAGGAGNEGHLIDGLIDKRIDAVATANLFNFIGDGLVNARKEAIRHSSNIATW